MEKSTNICKQRSSSYNSYFNCQLQCYLLYNVPTSGVTQLREDQLGRSGLNIKFKLQTKIMKGYKLSDSKAGSDLLMFMGSEGEAIPLTTQIAMKIHGILLRHITSSIYLTAYLDQTNLIFTAHCNSISPMQLRLPKFRLHR